MTMVQGSASRRVPLVQAWRGVREIDRLRCHDGAPGSACFQSIEYELLGSMRRVLRGRAAHTLMHQIFGQLLRILKVNRANPQAPPRTRGSARGHR